jgi:hypothetical protein
MIPTSLPSSSTTRLLRWLLSTRLACQPQLHTYWTHGGTQRPRWQQMAVYPEMEFMDTNLTKNLNIFLHAIHSLFHWRISRVLNIPTKKIHKTRKLESIHEKHFVERKILVENLTKLESEKSSCPKISTKTAVQEFHLLSGSGKT